MIEARTTTACGWKGLLLALLLEVLVGEAFALLFGLGELHARWQREGPIVLVVGDAGM